MSGKNIRLLLGKPLLVYTLECARACPAVGLVIVSTDSDAIAAVAESAGVPVPFRRPASFATDTAAKIMAIRHATEYVEAHDGFLPEIVVDLDVGAPLRAPEDITRCIEELQAHEADAAVTVYEAERNPYFNMVEFADGDYLQLVRRPAAPVVRRQDAPAVFSVSGSVFAFRRSRLDQVTHLYNGRWRGCIVPRERALDIDREVDFRLVELLLREAQTREL